MNEKFDGKPVALKESLFSLKTVFGFAVAAGVLYLFFRNFDFSSAVEAISRANWIYIIFAFIVYYLTLPARGIRWGMLLEKSFIHVQNSALIKYYFLSWFVNALLPARLGDIYRAYLLKKNKSVSISLSLGVLFSERVFDLIIIGALTASSGAYFWSVLKGTSEKDNLIFGLMAVMMVAVLFLAAVFGLPRLIGIVPGKWRNRLSLFSTGLFKSPSALPVIVLMTLAIWLGEALRLYLVFQAFHIEAGFLTALFISQAALIIMSVPLSPAGLGLVEILMLKILISSGILTDLAGAITLVDRMISYWSLLVIGAVTYLITGDR